MIYYTNNKDLVSFSKLIQSTEDLTNELNATKEDLNLSNTTKCGISLNCRNVFQRVWLSGSCRQVLNNIKRYKVRLVATGYTQNGNIDYK